MRVYRIQKAKYTDPLRLHGSRIAPGRWNTAQAPVVYTAESRALAMHEIEVHYQHQALLLGWLLWTITIADAAIIDHTALQALPPAWASNPKTAANQHYGAAWVQSRASVGLCVPSVVVPAERNILINMHHPDADQVVTVAGSEPLRFDPRKWTSADG